MARSASDLYAVVGVFMKWSNKIWPQAWEKPVLRLCAWLLLLFCWRAGLAVEPKKQSGPSRRVSPAQSTNAPGPFQIKRGFRIELAAAEPMVAAPAALAFDERGRLFVAEMRDYPDRREQSPHLGQIRMLEDMDENGVFQTSTVYADNLPWPSAVAKAASAAAMAFCSLMGLPRMIASASIARHGTVATPPSAMRTLRTAPPSC